MQPTTTQSFDSIWQIQKDITDDGLHATARVWGTRFHAQRVRERSGWERGLKLLYSSAAVIN